MGCFEDSKFIKLVEDTWTVCEPIQAKVDPRDVETLINAVRSNLIKFGSDKHHEEFVLRELFRQFDRDSNGQLTVEEVRGMLQMLNISADEAHLIAFIEKIDINKSGTIDFEEFLDMMTARMSDRDTREDIDKVFRLFDDDGTGTITIRNLRRVARELGETMTDEELQEMIDRADSNGDSAVTPDDFYNIMTKKTFV